MKLGYIDFNSTLTKLQELSEMTDSQVASCAGISIWMFECVKSGKLKNNVTLGSVLAGIVKSVQKKMNYTMSQMSEVTNIAITVLQDIESGKSQDWPLYLRCVEKMLKNKPMVVVINNNKANVFKIEKHHDHKPQKKDERFQSRKGRKTSLDWLALEKKKIISQKKAEEKKKKEWESSRKLAQAIMAGTIVLPDPPSLYPEPSFLKSAVKRYEESKFKLHRDNVTLADSNEKHRFGKIIWELLDYLVHLKKYKGLLTKGLHELGYDIDNLMSLKDGSADHLGDYQIVAAYCLQLIGNAKGVNQNCWPKETLLYSHYCNIINNPTKENVSAETCERLFWVLKNIETKGSGRYDKQISRSHSRRASTTAGANIRHQSYSSNSDFDYGITDT